MKSADDSHSNDSSNRPFSEILDADCTRRRLLQGSIGAAALGFLNIPAAQAAKAALKAGRPTIGFKPIAVSTADTVQVPEGYSVQLLYAWGDPVSAGPAFKPDASNSAAEQALQAGMHHDGIHFFPFMAGGKPSSTHGVLCVNHEYTDDGLLHSDGMNTWSAEKVAKSKAAHGVSVIEVKLDGGRWQVVRPSKYGRRITADTPVLISGPAAGHALLRTTADRRGRTVFGTLNNCAMGYTPWGTYLTCEENFHIYFNAAKQVTPDEKRYGLRENGLGYRWHEFDERFDTTKHPNEPHRFGWVVEIDPWNPEKLPVKRTALGRIKHEGALTTLAKDGRVVVYSGDDERFEYIYKFVSRDRYDPRDRTANADLLDDGTLYVAKFGEDGKGRWLELVQGKNGLTEENGFRDQGEVLIKARQAADRAGATKMDRPEWIAIHPASGELYCSLTNNSQRGTSAVPGLNAANPRSNNVFGHIIRWREAKQDPAALAFEWDVFVYCGDPKNSSEAKRGNIKGDVFGSPDGLWFDPDGRLWIQTDVSTSVLNKDDYASMGNNQMLCADVQSREIKRFLTGPNGCEITGIVVTPDRRNLFISIQHPGETASERTDPAKPKGISSWPEGEKGGRPRSATIVIRKNDGGVIGT
jgi:secreted PhoX family phosphatase